MLSSLRGCRHVAIWKFKRCYCIGFSLFSNFMISWSLRFFFSFSSKISYGTFFPLFWEMLSAGQRHTENIYDIYCVLHKALIKVSWLACTPSYGIRLNTQNIKVTSSSIKSGARKLSLHLECSSSVFHLTSSWVFCNWDMIGLREEMRGTERERLLLHRI